MDDRRELTISINKNEIANSVSDIEIPDNINSTVDLAIFAGQSNMAGRGNALDAEVCDINAGFEYKSISNPTKLLSICEPFGLGEDKEGGLTDIDDDGTTKRTGSMVTAVVNKYYENTGRQIVALSASKGGTPTEEWKSGLLDDALARVDNAVEFLKSSNISIGRIFVVWCQGESDADNDVSSEQYKENICEIMSGFREHGVEHCFMVQIGHYKNSETLDRHYSVIRAAQSELCSSDDYFTMTASFEPYKSQMKDNYHYYQSAYNAVGAACGTKIAEYYNRFIINSQI